MFIDILVAILLVWAIIKGYSKGLIIAIFSLLALVIGLAAAMKLSTVVASWMKDSINIAAKWLPVIAFILVFLVAVLLVRLGAKALQKTAEMAMLGWADKIGGIVFYAVLYIIVLSVALFYAEKIHLISAATIASSKTYNFIQPWGPAVINKIGAIVPWFSNMFHDLEQFFAKMVL